MSDQYEIVMLSFSPSMDLSRVGLLQVQVSVWLVLVGMSTLAMEGLVLEELILEVSDSLELGLEVSVLDLAGSDWEVSALQEVGLEVLELDTDM